MVFQSVGEFNKGMGMGYKKMLKEHAEKNKEDPGYAPRSGFHRG